jgi:hypothetical protein
VSGKRVFRPTKHNDVATILEYFVERQAWNNESLVEHLSQYIERQRDNGALLDFLCAQANEENQS